MPPRQRYRLPYNSRNHVLGAAEKARDLYRAGQPRSPLSLALSKPKRARKPSGRAVEKRPAPRQAPAPPPQVSAPRTQRAGGCPPTHSWKVIAQQIDHQVEGESKGNGGTRRRRPLPLNEKGEPDRARAKDLMIELFRKYEKTAPTETSIYRWIRENWPRCQNWWQN